MSFGYKLDLFINAGLWACALRCVTGFRLCVLFSEVLVRRYVTIHDCPYLPRLWSVTLSSLITRCLWLHCGSERCPSSPLSLSDSFCLPLSCSLPFLSLSPPSISLRPLCSVAHRRPWALPFSAWGALLCTCDIGCVCVRLCVYVHTRACVWLCFRPCEGSQSYNSEEDRHLQLCLKGW